MKAVVAAFNQEKALVGAFSVITNLRMEVFEALVTRCAMPRTMFQLKANLMPHLYWNGLIKGWWEGPGPFRRILSLGLSK